MNTHFHSGVPLSASPQYHSPDRLSPSITSVIFTLCLSKHNTSLSCTSFWTAYISSTALPIVHLCSQSTWAASTKKSPLFQQLCPHHSSPGRDGICRCLPSPLQHGPQPLRALGDSSLALPICRTGPCCHTGREEAASLPEHKWQLG